jgi:hypothetical protein
MQEILAGVFHWTAVHPRIQIEVSSYYVEEPGVLLDALLPPEGAEWFRDRVKPQHTRKALVTFGSRLGLSNRGIVCLLPP